MTTLADQNTESRRSDSLESGKLIHMLKRMMLIRRFEERTAQSYQQAKIGGFCHLYIGQEAVAVGSVSALRDDDPIITAYRDHGHALARGMHPNYAMAEMFGKLAGCCKGKGGSMHFFDKPRHMFGGHAIVGGQCPLGIGLAFATKYNNEDKVTVCYLGDGALNQGAFHEAMNLAAIWKLPILFAVENNAYSMGTHIARGTSRADDLGVKAQAYGMRFERCDGMDVLDVYNTFSRQAEQARSSQGDDGPALVEVATYRYKGHSMSDPQKYRTKDEVAEYEEQDGIQSLANHLIAKGFANEEQIDAFDKEAKELAVTAVKFAQDADEVPLDELFTDVFINPPGPPFKVGELPEMLLREQEAE